jgi:hypothetical protein
LTPDRSVKKMSSDLKRHQARKKKEKKEKEIEE